MNALRMLRDEISKLGYTREAILDSYVFSDVFAATPSDRTIPIAAFTRTPASYRNAAFGVIAADNPDMAMLIRDYRALGAPLLFAIDGNNISVWQVIADAQPRQIERVRQEDVPALFEKYAATWNPDSIHRAKSIGQMDRAYQLDFVDIGLLPAIEGQIHDKLDRLLADTLHAINSERTRDSRHSLSEQAIFRTVFRLLAAKILQDRDHPLAKQWDPNNLETVLSIICERYKLPELPNDRHSERAFDIGWKRLLEGISFRNISADDLAFVYENTLVTTATRQKFGTHSTPRQVAEFVVNRLAHAHVGSQGNFKVYEPFAGAAVFLVAAMRQMKDMLPTDWTDEQRHKFLVSKVSGDELDSFASEVAQLSLILADYPNANGWHIGQVDLFAKGTLADRAKGADMVLCNPPFQDFTHEERQRYPAAFALSHSKPISALATILDTRPASLGFVLPPLFVDGKKYAQTRKRIESIYRNIEIVELPERIFKKSLWGSALLIASDVRNSKTESGTVLRSSGVNSQDRDHFLKTGEVSFLRELSQDEPSPNGRLWIRELDSLWQYLEANPRFSQLASVSRGIEWKGGQPRAISSTARPGFVRGIGSASDIFQFASVRPSFLDIRPNRLRGNAISLPWKRPKLLANAVRRSRGAWNLAATIDRKGLVASQQLFGIWPTKPDAISLELLAAILNGPIANAFVRDNSFDARLLVSAVEKIPIPFQLPNEVSEMVRTYVAAINDDTLLIGPSSEKKVALLNKIDAAILKAYDLPPKLERTLLEQFRDSERPTLDGWPHWLPENFTPYIPLHEFLSEEYQVATQPWIQEVFKPLPPDEAATLREYVD